ncbi:MAG: hypothetical protein U0414_37605 [Polyangiaceae bacterium]
MGLPEKRLVRPLGGTWASARAAFALAFAVTAALPGGALAQPKDPVKDPKVLEEAKRHMEAGTALYNDPGGAKCEEAVKEFSKAYELSGSVKAARARGICEMALEQDGAAIDDLQLYVDHPPKDAQPGDVAQAENDLKALKAVVATITFKTDGPNTALTAVRTPSQGLPITNHYTVSLTGTTLRIHPGQYTFTANSEGNPEIKWTVEIKNGETNTKIIEFEVAKRNAKDKDGPKPPETPTESTRPIPVSAWIVGGLTVAFIAPTVAFGVLGIQGKDEFNEKNGKASKTELEDLKSDVALKSALSDVFLGLTVAGAVTTTILIVTRPTVTKPAQTGWLMLPTLDVDAQGAARGAGLAFMGSF